MSIAVSVLPTALFYCCDPDLRTYIMCDLRGDVANMVKVDLPAAIKRLAVKDESTLVYLIKLSKMIICGQPSGPSCPLSICGSIILARESGCATHLAVHVGNQDVLLNSTSVKRSSTTTW